jgi:hypothetical protein
MHLDIYPDKVSRSYSVWMSDLKYHNLSVQDTCTIPRPALTHPSPSPLPLPPNLAQVHVIAPLAPHERRLRHNSPAQTEPIIPDTRSQNAAMLISSGIQITVESP